VVASPMEAKARALVAVKHLDWEKAASGALGPQLRAIAEKLGTLEARAKRAHEVLGGIETGTLGARAAFKLAGSSLEKAAYKAAVAKELARPPGRPEETLNRMVAARQELRGVQEEATGAETALRDFAGGARETPWALGEARAIRQAARGAEIELGQTEARGEMLAEMDAGTGVFAEAAPAEPAGEGTTSETAAPSAEGEFGEEDLRRIGSGLDPNKPPVQTHWSEHMVNLVSDHGRKQGGITDEQGGRNGELARVVLSGQGEETPRELGAADVAAVLKMSGVDLSRVDPNQLQSAARYVSGAATLSEQQDKLRKTLDSFQVLEKIGLPKLTRQEMVDQLWGIAKVPGHALQKLSDTEVQKKLQEVLQAVNGGAGKAEIKVGKHNLKLEVGSNGQVTKSSCKQPSFMSKVWKAVKVVTPIALTILSFTPLAPFALAAQGAIALVQAIKAKSICAPGG